MRKALLILAFLAAAASASADEIRLHSGQVVVGRIVQQTSAFVTIETMVNGSRATLTYSRTQIRSVTRGEIPDSFFEPPEPAPPPTVPGERPPAPSLDPDPLGQEEDDEGEIADQPAVGELTDALRYMVIPLKGEVGREITARGVRDAIRLGKRQRLNALVFLIDTEGGRVADAEAIARVMDEERSDMKYYAVVARAISAGVWPLSRSDRIFFEPGGVAGASVAYSIGIGQVEVDAKFNAAVAAGLAAAAEARGQIGQIYRAMVLMDAALHQWRDAEGVVRLSGTPPPPGALDHIEVVSSNAVLALTSKQAHEIGFAVELPSKDLSEIGPLVDAENWESVGPIGARPMHAAQREIERRERLAEAAAQRVHDARSQVVDLVRQAPRLRDAAVAADPSRITVYYRDGSGTLTPDSQMRWRQQTDEAVARWNDFQRLLGRIRSAERSAERALDQYNNARVRVWEARLYDETPEPIELAPVDHGLDLDQLNREVEDKKSQLISRRMRTNVAR